MLIYTYVYIQCTYIYITIYIYIYTYVIQACICYHSMYIIHRLILQSLVLYIDGPIAICLPEKLPQCNPVLLYIRIAHLLQAASAS